MTNYRDEYRELLAVLRSDIDNKTKMLWIEELSKKVESDEDLLPSHLFQLQKNLAMWRRRIWHRMQNEL